MVARIRTVSFQGIDVLDIDVEVQLASGLPAFTIVGYINSCVLLLMLMLFIPSAVAAENYPTEISNDGLSRLYRDGMLEEMQFYAARGNIKAQTWLGLMLHNRSDYAGAMKWYSLAADNGDAWAISQIIFLYERGLGRPKNLIAAAEWQRKGAQQGYPGHQMDYAERLVDGTRGVPKNESEAFKWMLKAADQKYIYAYLPLAEILSKNQGQNYDPVKAYAYAKYYEDHSLPDSSDLTVGRAHKLQSSMWRLLSKEQKSEAAEALKELGE